MPNARTTYAMPVNEPVLGYLPGSEERKTLDAAVQAARGQRIEIPLVIGGREIRTGQTVEAVMPHAHGHVLATVHQAGPKEVELAVDAALEARRTWSTLEPERRAAIMLKAATLLAGPWRMRVNAATMLNQSKTCHQAEIDSACEMIDFLRFNVAFMFQIYEQVQPPISLPGVRNELEARPLEGFVYAITPFNFTSIAGNLPSSPVLMGNTAIWKPSHSALYSNYVLMRLFEAAGLPPGVINFVPGSAAAISKQLFAHPEFAGLHYTGSTDVFQSIWRSVGEQLPNLRNYPRLVGETGGKDFVIAHPSANRAALVAALVRGAYEYQGQKCSAASRAYIARSVWDGIKDDLVDEIGSIRMGDPTTYTNFMGAVIHRQSFEKCQKYIEAARASHDAEILVGGDCRGAEGYFVAPTLIETKSPRYATMCEEIFGPILTLYVYEDEHYADILDECDRTSPYALTGAIFADEQDAVNLALDRLRYAAGNFYINDKPTGAVVGQQPFGGARMSGTNDKAGSALNLLRWVSPRTIKETFDPPLDYRYGFMA